MNKLILDEGQAKKIMVFLIRQAYILYRMDTADQRMDLDKKLLEMKNSTTRDKIKNKGEVDYDHVLKEELDEMELDKQPVDSLEIKMFTYMTLAGIKPVQNNQQRASGFSRFIASAPPEAIL